MVGHSSRRQRAESVRVNAAALAGSRPSVQHVNNGEEFEYRDHGCEETSPSYVANFTKGLPHDPDTGLLLNPVDYELFVTGIQTGRPIDFARTPLGPGVPPVTLGCPSRESITCDSSASDRRKAWKSKAAQQHDVNGDPGALVRAWESAGAGNVFDLEGPDAQSVTMPPVPRLNSDERLAEVVEVYAMALLRDLPFRRFPLSPSGGKAVRRERDRTKFERRGTTRDFEYATGLLGDLPWFYADATELELSPNEISRRRTLADDGSNLFRGQTPGEQVGPYLSQFLLLGNEALGGGRTPCDGFLRYGAIGIQQKVRIATPGKDYLTAWKPFLDVQNGADLRGAESYVEPDGRNQGYRFITTPRDLATYVHYDALYEAHLNACISLSASEAPFVRGILFSETDVFDKQQGFAHFGGPHILTLVCEVATRALKAVRYQKFNLHRRLRPEAVGGLIDRFLSSGSKIDSRFEPVRRRIEGDDYSDGFSNLGWSNGSQLIDQIKQHNAESNKTSFAAEPSAKQPSYLLPMAFPEGSPRHPSYGAGHATVAGACVTILKAYFDHGWTPPVWLAPDATPVAFEASNDGSALLPIKLAAPLTVEGELNKLAANISIGRNWAGVHYDSDYIESIRMGEQIVIGLLEEQKLTYPGDFSMTVPLFDGGAVRI